MYNYAIDLVDGKAEADGGHALMLRARQKSIWGGEEHQSVPATWQSGDWNISDLGTKPTDTPTNQRLVPIICGQAELPIPAGQKILFGPVDRPVRRESTNLAVALKSMTNTEA